ncbi:MAG: sulfatase-like hydrolase/transferase [Actinomycetota bacterium]
MAVVSIVAASCQFDPAQFQGTGVLEELCQGQVGTHGFGYTEVTDPAAGSVHEATDGDDVIVIANGPVTVDAGAGDDVICVTDGWTSEPGAAITIIGGPGTDTVIASPNVVEHCEAEVHDCDDDVAELPASPPNVIYIMTDDLGYGDLPAYNPASPILAPNLDQLAADGMTLTGFHTAAPICSPTRAAFLTGQDPGTFGLRTIVGAGSTTGLLSDPETLAEMFNGHGYDTHHVGKWHLGTREEQDALASGFQNEVVSSDFYFDFWLGTERGLPVTQGQTNVRQPIVWENYRGTVEHSTELFTDRAIDLIEESTTAGDPFFLNLWYNAPHVETGSGVGPIPWQLPVDHPLHGDPDATAAEVYIALVELIDEQVGRIMTTLDTEGVADETLIIFTSDNGPIQPNPNYLPWSTAGLKGKKNVHEEAGIRVPFIVRWPDVIEAGSTSADFGVTEDLFPTFAALVGDEGPPGTQGASLLPTLRGVPNPSAMSRTVVFEGADQRKTTDLDLVNPYDHAVIEDGRWKYVSIAFGPSPNVALYDLLNDPNETTNLLNDPAQADRVARLLGLYTEWSHATSRAALTSGGSPMPPTWSGAFDGSTAVVVDHHPTLDSGNNDFTLTVDLTPTAAAVSSPNGVVVADRPGSWTIRITPGGLVEVDVTDNLGTTTTLRSASTLTAGVTTRVTFTLKGWVAGSVSERQTMGRLYLDAVREDLQPVAPGFEHVEFNGNDLVLGDTATADGFDGTMDSFEIHNKTLDAIQIAAVP